MRSTLFAALASWMITSCAALPDVRSTVADAPELPPFAFAADEEALSSAKLGEDLTALYEGLQQAHYDLYARQSRQAYDALFAEMLAAFDQPLRPSEAIFPFQRFVAFGNIAHARMEGINAVWARYRAGGGKALPVFPKVQEGKLFVKVSYDPSVVPGERIVAIEGEAAAVWLSRLYKRISADNDYLAGSLLEMSFPFHLIEAMGPEENVTLTLEDGDGARRDVAIPTIDLETLKSRRQTEGSQFSFDASGRKSAVLDDGIAYLQPGPFYGIETPENPWDNSAFKDFIDDSFGDFLEAEARALIIDLRQNPGGDNSFSDHMIAWFADEPFRFVSEFDVRSSAQSAASNQARIDLDPSLADGVSGDLAAGYESTPYGETFTFELPFARPRAGRQFEGPVYAIIDRYSYSNAVNVASILQDYGFATILGEETSDLATSYGAMETFELPHSGLTVGYPKALIIRPSGDVSDRGVRPDVAFKAPVIADRDVFLEKTLAHVRRDLSDDQ